jgi:HSP20 family protein
MAFTTWNPFRELEALRREVERAFESFGFEQWTGPFRRTAFLPGVAPRTYPLVNVSEDRDNVYVEALAPGLDTGTLEVLVLRDTLRITGEKQALAPDINPDAYHRSERSAGKFVRTVTLPVEVDGDKVKAQYENGLLLITLPKAEVAKPKQIAIQVS